MDKVDREVKLGDGKLAGLLTFTVLMGVPFTLQPHDVLYKWTTSAE